MRSGHYFEVLPCNFNGTIRQKMRFGHNIWLEGPIDLDQRVSTAFCKIFSGTPHLTIFGALKYAPKYAKYGQKNLSLPNLHLIWSFVRWPVHVVDLKAVHHVRLDHISGSLPIRPMPLIVVHIYWNARPYHHEDHVLLLTLSLSVTVSPLWCPLLHPCQDTIKLPYSTNVITSKSKNDYLSKKTFLSGNRALRSFFFAFHLKLIPTSLKTWAKYL